MLIDVRSKCPFELPSECLIILLSLSHSLQLWLWRWKMKCVWAAWAIETERRINTFLLCCFHDKVAAAGKWVKWGYIVFTSYSCIATGLYINHLEIWSKMELICKSGALIKEEIQVVLYVSRYQCKLFSLFMQNSQDANCQRMQISSDTLWLWARVANIRCVQGLPRSSWRTLCFSSGVWVNWTIFFVSNWNMYLSQFAKLQMCIDCLTHLACEQGLPRSS